MVPTTSSIEFPIGEIMGDAPMKPIPLTAPPNLHGLSMEDPNTIVFKFDIVFRWYDYVNDP